MYVHINCYLSSHKKILVQIDTCIEFPYKYLQKILIHYLVYVQTPILAFKKKPSIHWYTGKKNFFVHKLLTYVYVCTWNIRIRGDMNNMIQ
jgi:hypothetical protein